jgi:hypothetical protein
MCMPNVFILFTMYSEKTGISIDYKDSIFKESVWTCESEHPERRWKIHSTIYDKMAPERKNWYSSVT